MMDIKPRDLDTYVKAYQSLPFEPILIEYRRRCILEQIASIQPRSLLEIGCGENPLFTSLSDRMDICVIEAADAFAQNAQALASNRTNVKVIHGLIENMPNAGNKFDMVVLSCVLHEVPDPKAMLQAIHPLCQANTVLHVNVPNANSFHRLWAVAMGLIPQTHQVSETQRTMQQLGTVYTMDTLTQELNNAGFTVQNQGGLFIKPFTHQQMQTLVDTGLLTPAMLDGLDRMGRELPHMASEIWVNAQSRA